MEPDVIGIIMSAAGIAGLWLYFNVYHHELRRDRYRSTLFGVRDDLFDLARSGEISFGDDSYRSTRSLVNGMLNVGYTIGWLPIIVYAVRSAKAQRTTSSATQIQPWEREGLTPRARQGLRRAYLRAHMAWLEYQLSVSLALFFWAWPLFELVRLFVRFRGGKNGVARRVNETMQRLDQTFIDLEECKSAA